MQLNRTDLAIESHEIAGEIEGAELVRYERDNIKVSELKITTEEAAKELSKPCGSYITIEAEELLYNTGEYECVCRIISEYIRKLAPCDGEILVAGLGNRDITPDALGPEVVSRVFVTNHIKEQLDYDFAQKLGRVSAIAPGVLGTTGMETSQIIRGVVNEQKPSLIIAVDAYAAHGISRLANTVQLSDTGLIPGGGVGNRRSAIDEQALGVPVIAIGVPTVVDAAALAADMLDMADEGAVSEKLGTHAGELVVTPKNIDLIIDRAAKTVANGINLAAHPDLTIEEIESYIG